MAYSHCMGTGPGQVQGIGPTQQETMGHGSFPCLGPVSTILYNTSGTIGSSSIPFACPSPLPPAVWISHFIPFTCPSSIHVQCECAIRPTPIKCIQVFAFSAQATSNKTECNLLTIKDPCKTTLQCSTAVANSQCNNATNSCQCEIEYKVKCLL